MSSERVDTADCRNGLVCVAGPFVCWLLAVIAGVILGRLGVPSGLWLAGLGICALGWVLVCRGKARNWAWYWMLALGMCLGGWRMAHSLAPRVQIDEPVLVRFEVKVDRLAEPLREMRGALSRWHPLPVTAQTEAKLERLDTGAGWQLCRGRVRVYVSGDVPLQGERLVGTGWLHPLRGGWRSRGSDRLFAMRGDGLIGSLVTTPDAFEKSGAAGWHQSLVSRSRQSLRAGMADDDTTTLASMLLLGGAQKDGAPLRSMFRKAGLAHVLALSGAHLVVLLFPVWVWARLCGRPRLGMWGMFLFLASFLVCVPWHAPILRAALVVGMLTLAWGLSRSLRARDALALAAGLLLLWRPADLWDAGFQLTFVASGALVIFALALSARTADALLGATPLQPVMRWQLPWWKRTGLRLLDALIGSLVACAVIWPLAMLHFGECSPLGFLASLLVSPLVALTLYVGYVKLLLGMICPGAGEWMGWLLHALASALMHTVEWISSFPAARWQAPRPAPWPLAIGSLAVVIVGMTLGCGYWQPRRPRRAALCWCMCALACVLSTWGWWHHARIGQRELAPLQWHALPVGEGSAHVVRCGDAVLLFDGGSRTQGDVGLRVLLPNLRRLAISQIDLMVVSHDDLDHFSGLLDVAQELPVKRALLSHEVMMRATQDLDSPAHALVTGLSALGVPCEMADAEKTGQLGSAQWRVLWPSSGQLHTHSNANSVVMRVDLGAASVLLTGDAEDVAAAGLQGQLGSVTAMELPHHGSWNEGAQRMVREASPSVIIQSSGARHFKSDPWQAFLETLPTPPVRAMTAREGPQTILLWPDGSWVRQKP